MKKILLNKFGRKFRDETLYALVDDDMYDELSKHNWYSRGSTNFYAARTIPGVRTCRHLLMHRAIVGAKKGEYVDHIDRNSLNNQRDNLRICSARDNALNTEPRSATPCIYFKVKNPRRPYVVQIVENRKSRYIGSFPTLEQAEAARDQVWRLDDRLKQKLNQ